jgi:hypothetical protein
MPCTECLVHSTGVIGTEGRTGPELSQEKEGHWHLKKTQNLKWQLGKTQPRKRKQKQGLRAVFGCQHVVLEE